MLNKALLATNMACIAYLVGYGNECLRTIVGVKITTIEYYSYNYGNGMMKYVTDTDDDGYYDTSTKYITKYTNGTSNIYGYSYTYGTSLEHGMGKIGDATKEVNVNMGTGGAGTNMSHWFSDYSYLPRLRWSRLF